MSKTREDKTWKFDKSGDYYTDLAMKESTNRPTAINPGGYIGLYQFGEMALVDIGYYKKDLKPGQKPKALYNHDWTGTWTCKHDICSREEFLANRTVQDIAIREYHKRIWERYLRSYQQYEGQEVGGIKLTQSGMISCAHLVGQETMKEFIKSNGATNEKDKNGTTCADYLKGFLRYVVDYSTDQHIKKLQSPESPKPVPLKQVPDNTAFNSSDNIKAARCARLYKKYHQLLEERDTRQRDSARKGEENKRSTREISEELTTYEYEFFFRAKCAQPESFYAAIKKNYINEKEGR